MIQSDRVPRFVPRPRSLAGSKLFATASLDGQSFVEVFPIELTWLGAGYQVERSESLVQPVSCHPRRYLLNDRFSL